MAARFGSIPMAQLSLKDRQTFSKQSCRFKHVTDDHRLEHIQLEMAAHAADIYSHIVPITCAQTMVMASGCVGFTFPGMIEDPGSFSGRMISPMPQRGP